MEWIFDLAYLAILLPVFGLLANALLGHRLGEKAIGFIGCLAVGLTFILSILTLVGLLGVETSGETAGVRFVERVLYDWVVVGSLHIPIALRVDPLSVTMMLVVTGVGLLIHIYATGYMHGDPRYQRFFVFFNLFVASMLVLVLANNYLMMFVGWEMVGLCSYLLIGFWFEDIENSVAGKKAFIVNRVGDFGFILAVLLMLLAFGTLEFTQVFDAVGQGNDAILWGITFRMKDVVTAITLLLFIGATGKSAQIPLFVWLPDAMAGPTPVSALIHAATMVTAGIYMITRSAPMYDIATLSSNVVAGVGALTAVVAASIAVAQFDIKRVLAYSTISQLGFMVAAVGLGGYAAGIFHLVTHAFFKALLFLGAGSVIHGVEHGIDRSDQPSMQASNHRIDAHDPHDMRSLGGLRHRMKWTYAAYLVGWLALAGVFPLAGFWSKDEVLADAWAHNTSVGVLLTIAAFLTAFYMTRQAILIFEGDPRTAAAARAHESGPAIVVPLVILSALSVLGGTLNLPGRHSLAHFIGHDAAEFDLEIAAFSSVITLVAIIIAWAVYSRGRIYVDAPDRLSKMPLGLFAHLNRRWYWDDLYTLVAVRPFYWLAEKLATTIDWEFWHDFVHDSVLVEPFRATAAFLANPIDLGIVDGIANGIARLIERSSGKLGKLQTGYVRNYALSILLGVAMIMAWFVLR